MARSTKYMSATGFGCAMVGYLAAIGLVLAFWFTIGAAAAKYAFGWEIG